MTDINSDRSKEFVPVLLLSFAAFVVALRILIWRYVPSWGMFFREDFSNFVAMIAMLIPVLAWLFWRLFCGCSFRKSGLELPIGLWLVAVSFSLLYTSVFWNSLVGCLFLFSQVMFFFMLVDLLDRPSRLIAFTAFLMMCALVMSLRGIQDFIYLNSNPSLPVGIERSIIRHEIEYLFLTRRVTSFLGWPNTLAAYLMLFIPTIVAIPFLLKEGWQRALVVTAGIIFVACFLLTFSFLGWSSLLLACVGLVILLWRQGGIRDWVQPRQGFVIAAVSAVSILFLVVIIKKNFVGALGPRLLYYQSAWGMLVEKPFLGHGWGTFSVVGRRFSDSQGAMSAYVHNTYFQAWVEAGILGAIALLLLVVFFSRMVFSRFPDMKPGVLRVLFVSSALGLTAFFIDNLFSFTMLKPNVSLHFWVALAVFCAVVNYKDVSRQIVLPRWNIVAGIGMVLAVLVLLVRLTAGQMLYAAGSKALQAQQYVHAVEFFDSASGLDPWNAFLPTASGDAVLKRFATTQDAVLLDISAEYFAEAVRRSPEFHLPYFYLGRIYLAKGDRQTGLDFLRISKRLSPYEFSLDMDRLQTKRESASTKQTKPLP